MVVSSEAGRGEITRTGDIVEFDRRSLRLRNTNGQEIEIPASQIREFHYGRLASHQAADALRHAGDPAAAEAYAKAAAEEPRRWVRHEIAAARIPLLLREAAGREAEDRSVVEAGETFRRMLAENRDTRRFHAIPLNWVTHTPSPELTAAAKRWLLEEEAAVQLLGASWLLASPERAQAVDALGGLRTSGDARVAALAEAQLWRTQEVSIAREGADRWAAAIARMPEELTAGPSFILGRAYARLGDHEAAVLRLLRGPLLEAGGPALAAEALTAAGKDLEPLGRAGQAVTIYEEAIRRYGDTLAAEGARQRLAEAANK